MDLMAAMRVFVEIADRGSMTAAAAELARSQPAVVRSLAALESHLGARLMNRTTRRLSLTPEGVDYLARCRRILTDVEEAALAVRQDAIEPRGDLRITAPVLFGQMHVAPALTGFLRRYPEVRVDLLLFDRNVDVVDEGIDLAVRIGHLEDSALVATRTGFVTRQVCASDNLLREVGTPAHPRELAGLPCIRFNGLYAPGRWEFNEDGRDLTVQVSGNVSSNHLSVARGACLDGLGFGHFFSYQVQPLIAAGRLQRVLQDFEPAPLPVSLVYPGTRLVSARLRALLDWLKQVFSEEAALHAA